MFAFNSIRYDVVDDDGAMEWGEDTVENSLVDGASLFCGLATSSTTDKTTTGA